MLVARLVGVVLVLLFCIVFVAVGLLLCVSFSALWFGFDMFTFSFGGLLVGACLDLLVVLGLVSVYLCFILFGFVYFLWLLTLFERLFRVCYMLRFLWVNNVVVTGSLRYGFVWLLTFVLGFDSVVCVCYLGLSCARC